MSISLAGVFDNKDNKIYHFFMGNIDVSNQDRIIQQIIQQSRQEKIRLSIHGHQEMVKEDISYKELREAIAEGKVIENYPDHERGPCCLLCGQTYGGRYLHIVCTTSLEVLIIITSYEPKPPKWITPYKRREKNEM